MMFTGSLNFKSIDTKNFISVIDKVFWGFVRLTAVWKKKWKNVQIGLHSFQELDNIN